LVDPEAAEIVMNSGLKLTMIGLEVTHQAWLDDSHADELRGKGECGEFVAELLDHFCRFFTSSVSAGPALRSMTR